MLKIINPTGLPAPRGFNHGLLVEGGKLLFVAGQTGLGRDGVPADLVAQFARALDGVKQVVEEAGGRVEHIARLTIYVTDIETYRQNGKELGAAYREVFGRHYPAMTLLEVNSLVDSRLLVEIEAVAVLP